MISRHPSLTPICRDLHPLHRYTHPFNLTSRWWLEAHDVCVNMCAQRPLCARCFSPYANHSLALRINLQMCHYPSGSAAITLQLHNSRLASWAPCTHAGKCMRTHTLLLQCWTKKLWYKDAAFYEITFCYTTKRKKHAVLYIQVIFSMCNHSSSP